MRIVLNGNSVPSIGALVATHCGDWGKPVMHMSFRSFKMYQGIIASIGG